MLLHDGLYGGVYFRLSHFLVELQIQILYEFLQASVDFERLVKLVQWCGAELRSYRLIHVDEGASWFGAELAAERFLQDHIFALNANCVIIELPPLVEVSIVYVGVVMAALCESLMDHYRMKVVRHFLRLQKRVLELRPVAV